MAFSNTTTSIYEFANGWIIEEGTFSGAGVTTGIITAATNGSFSAGSYIMDIKAWGFASDGDTAILPAKDGYPNAIKLTFTSADTGDYWIMGKAL